MWRLDILRFGLLKDDITKFIPVQIYRREHQINVQNVTLDVLKANNKNTFMKDMTLKQDSSTSIFLWILWNFYKLII